MVAVSLKKKKERKKEKKKKKKYEMNIATRENIESDICIEQRKLTYQTILADT